MNRSLQNKSLRNKVKWSLGILLLLLAFVPVKSIGHTKVYADNQKNRKSEADMLLDIPTTYNMNSNTANIIFSNEDNTENINEQDIYNIAIECNPISADDIDLTSSVTEICKGKEVTLESSTVLPGLVNPVFKWYKNIDLTDIPKLGEQITVSLTETTTFYVTLEADGYCFNIPAKTIEIEVNDLPTTPTITTATDFSFCEGSSLLLETDNTAFSYKWFKGELEIDGAITANLEATEAGDYKVVAVNEEGCESELSEPIEITLLPQLDAPVIEPTGATICMGGYVDLKVLGEGLSEEEDEALLEASLYRWYKEGEPLSDIAAIENQMLKVIQPGSYAVTITDPDTGCESELSVEVVVEQIPGPDLNLTGSTYIYQVTGGNLIWPEATTSPDSTIMWYDNNDELVDYENLPESFSAVGVYTYTVVATSANGCYTTENIVINIYDADACPPGMERVYAEWEDWGSIITGGVSNGGNAVDGNPKTHSTITTGLGLLGIGTTWQNIYWEEVVPAGTPVTIKLGKEYSGLVLAGGLSVVGIGTNGMDIGVIKPVKGGLLDLLSADSVVEFTFVPSNISGPKAYTGIRISQGSLIGVAQNAKVYGAHYTKPAIGQQSCEPVVDGVKSSIQDVLYGVEDIGLGVVSATASVVDPWNAVDGNLDTAAHLVRGVSVLNAATLTVIFKEHLMPTDEIKITMQDIRNSGLNVNLLTGYRFQRYNGSTAVGDPIQGGDVLDLKLLNFRSDKIQMFVNSYDEPYDRIKISVGSIVQVALSDQMKIYDVDISPSLDYGQIEDQDFEICVGDNLELEMQDECTAYEVFDGESESANRLESDDSFNFTIPEVTPTGENTFYVQAIRYGCPIGERQEIKVVVNDKPVLESVEIDGNVENFTTIFEVSPAEVIEIKPTLDWGNSNKSNLIWQMENPSNLGEWINIPFAQVAMDGTLTLTIPNSGTITLPDNSVIDIRNTDIPIRLFLESDKGCQALEEGLVLRIDGKSYFMNNPNTTNRLN